jgi:hypothetical protein
VKLSTLTQKNPAYNEKLWAKYHALYVGGDVFAGCVPDFLPRNPQEEENNYRVRCGSAQYTNYVGPIIDFFAAKVMNAPVEAKPLDDEEEPEFYEEWREDVDGSGSNLVDFFRARFVDACVKGLGWWSFEVPDAGETPPANLAEYEDRGLGRVTLAAIDRAQVIDWQADVRGELEWAIVHAVERPRRSPDESRGAIVETWKVYDRERVTTYAIAYTEDKPPRPDDEVPMVAQRLHGFPRVPLMCMGFEGTRPAHVKIGLRNVALSTSQVRGLWPMGRLADIQTAHFRQEAALEWSIARTCYAMPVFRMEDKPPTMGAGYYIMIKPTESVEWTAPPTAHLGIAEQRVATRRDEIYRVANQLAQGVDNNAAAIGRSADSKLADAASTEVVLTIFGAFVREAIEKTFDLVSEARTGADMRPDDKPLRWMVSGLDKFDVTDVAALMAAVTQFSALNIPSRTASAAIKTRAAIALLQGATEEQRKKIEEEIEDGTTAEEAIVIPEAPPEKPGAPRPGMPTRQPVAAKPAKAPVTRKALAAKKAA